MRAAILLSMDVPALMDDVVRRYLGAIQGAQTRVRRRERANCLSLLSLLGDESSLIPSERLIEQWLGDASHDTRRHRLTTLRRLLAITPGDDAAALANWVDENRRRLTKSIDKVVPLFPSGARQRSEARREATEALDLLARGDAERARFLADHALELDPACMPAHAVVGTIELDAQRPFAALQQFRQALVLAGDPSERDGIEGIPDVLAGLGRALLVLGCLDEAREVFMRLSRAGSEWRRHSATPLGRIAFVLDEPESAVELLADGRPIDQFSVMLARLRLAEPLKAAIAFYRGLLDNPFVPATLLRLGDKRFENAFPAEMRDEKLRAAKAYAIEFAEFWARAPGTLRLLRRHWDLPTTRAFMMRTLALEGITPASARVAVWVHAAAKAAVQELGATTKGDSAPH